MNLKLTIMKNKELINYIKQYTLGEGGLKLWDEENLKVSCIEKINIINNSVRTNTIFTGFQCVSTLKPYLNPISLLIDNTGELSFLTELEIEKIKTADKIGVGLIEFLHYHLSYVTVMKLLNLKFDVFGLIDKGYAISTQDERLTGIKIY